MRAPQGVMQQMPQLPVRLNVELANNFLPRATANGMCHMQHMPMQAMCLMPRSTCSTAHLLVLVTTQTKHNLHTVFALHCRCRRR